MMISDIGGTITDYPDVCHSGGAKGADKLFGECATKAGHLVRHYGFQGHFSPCPKEQVITLNAFALSLANPHLEKANVLLGRKFPTRSEYVNNLLRRNYYQVERSKRIYATTPIDENFVPIGGTAWAIVMGINRHVPEIYNFCWKREMWFRYNYGQHSLGARWEVCGLDEIPIPSGEYAGIGSSELPDNAAQAIVSLYDR